MPSEDEWPGTFLGEYDPSAAPQGPTGLLEDSNIPLTRRSSEYEGLEGFNPIIVNYDGRSVMIPTIWGDQGIQSDDDAIARYEKTGEHLGVFDNYDNAANYAPTLHDAIVERDAFYEKYPDAEDDDYADYQADKEGWELAEQQGADNERAEAEAMGVPQQPYTDPEPNSALEALARQNRSEPPAAAPQPNQLPTEPFNFKQRNWRFETKEDEWPGTFIGEHDPSAKSVPEEEEKEEWPGTVIGPVDSGVDYDYAAAKKAGAKPDPETGHWPDTFKKPNHPTFSNESIYYKDAPDKAGHWEGDKFIPPKPKFKGPEWSNQPTFTGELGKGRIGSAALYGANNIGKFTDRLFAPGQDSGARLISPEVSKAGFKMGSYLLPPVIAAEIIGGKPKELVDAAREQFGESVSEFTSLEGLASLVAMPFYGVAEVFALGVIAKLPEQYARIKETVEKHGLFSPETTKVAVESGIHDLMGFLALKGGKILRKHPPKVIEKKIADMRERLKDRPVEQPAPPEIAPVEHPPPSPEESFAGPDVPEGSIKLGEEQRVARDRETAERRRQAEQQIEHDRAVINRRNKAEAIFEDALQQAKGPGPRSMAAEEHIARRKAVVQYMTNDAEILKAFDEAHHLASLMVESELGMNAPPNRPFRWVDYETEYPAGATHPTRAEPAAPPVVAPEAPSRGAGGPKPEPPAAEPAPVVEVARTPDVPVDPHEFTPALRLADAEPIIGEQGKFHEHIYEAAPDPVELRANDPEHGFVDSNKKFYTRRELADVFGETEGMTSERLLKLQQDALAKAEEAKAAARDAATQRLPEHLRPDPAIEALTATPDPIPVAGKKIKLKAKNKGGFIDPSIFNEAAEFGRRLYTKGMEYGAWSKQMMAHLGRGIVNHLRRIWDSLIGANMLPNSRQGGALFSGGGKTKRIGVTPKGDTEFLRVERAHQRLFKGLENQGPADILARSKNKIGKKLSDQMRKHTDFEQEIKGNLYTKFAKHIQGKERAKVDAAFEEVKVFNAARANGRPTPTLSPLAEKLSKTAWGDIAVHTGDMMQAFDVQVFDKATGKWRTAGNEGRDYLPRKLNEETMRALRDPDRYAEHYNKLVDAVAAQRLIAPEDAAALLQKEASLYSANDFQGNMELARGQALPEIAYEYDLRKIVPEYVAQFSERMAQIMAYGQRLGPREAPLRKNLWDIARDETGGDKYSQNWITQVENGAINLKTGSGAEQFASRAQTAASGLLLSSPTTSVMRNTVSGLMSTVEMMGVRRSTQALAKAIYSKQARMDAREIGTITHDLADLLHNEKLGGEFWDNIIRGATSKALKWSGYNGSEIFVRTHGTLASMKFVKDGVDAINKNPKSARAKEALAHFKRMGVDAETIVAEGGEWRTGPESRKFIRTVLRDTQGGYRFEQVPLWANGNAGRFFYQFGRWGTQRSRNIWKNGVKPMFSEKVMWKGQEMRSWNPRPMMKMLGGAVIAGEIFGGVAGLLFGRDRRDASLNEIKVKWGEDKERAFGMAMERAINDIIMSGTLGIWTQPLDFIKSIKAKSRLRNPADPASLASLRAVGDLILKTVEQGGTFTRDDALDFAKEVMPGATQLYDVGKNVINDPLYEAENDKRTLRQAALRWAKERGIDAKAPPLARFPKSEQSPYFEPIKEALMSGDRDKAADLTHQYIATQKKGQQAFENLIASVKASGPFRVGPYTSEKYRREFFNWAKHNLSAEDFNQIKRVHHRYIFTAKAAGLWPETQP